MKRTFRRPDGTEEVLEGTAEELAEYERKLNESERKPPKPGVLKGRGIADHLQQPYWPLMPGIWIGEPVYPSEIFREYMGPQCRFH